MIGFSPLSAEPIGANSLQAAHDLTGAPSLQESSAGHGAVSQVQVMAGAAAIQSNSSSGAALIQLGQLVAAPAVQGNSSSPGAVAQSHVLVVADSSQENIGAGGDVEIMQVEHNLTGSNSGQDNASGAASITCDQLLAGVGAVMINVSSVGAVGASLPEVPESRTFVFKKPDRTFNILPR